MSPFAHLLHDLRMQHNIRQSDLAELLGYEQSFISALEIGLKGPPSPDFVERFLKALPLSQEESDQLITAVEASQRKLVIDVDSHQDVYWLLDALRANISRLGPTKVRMIRDILKLTELGEASWKEPARRLRRRQPEGLSV